MVRLARGVKDWASRQAWQRQRLLRLIEDAYQQAGFQPLATPHIEREETLLSKFSGGEEIIREIFRLSDQAGRKLALRYDHTVPLARFTSLHKDLPLPYKRYAIGTVFRDGPVKRGRLREFIQADIDTIGAREGLADREILETISRVFRQLNLPFTIRINHRTILDSIMRDAGVAKPEDSILTLDKLEKIGREGVEAELREKGYTDETIKRIFILLEAAEKGSVPDGARDAYTFITTLTDKLPEAVFTPTLARGLNYYTGILFEYYTPGFNSAIAAGGRYARLFEQWGLPLEAVGGSIGVDALLESGILADPLETPGVYLIPIHQEEAAFTLAQVLREEGIPAFLLPSRKSISGAIRHAESLGYAYVIFIGEKEVRENTYTLKSLKTGEEEHLPLARLIETLRETIRFQEENLTLHAREA